MEGPGSPPPGQTSRPETPTPPCYRAPKPPEVPDSGPCPSAPGSPFEPGHPHLSPPPSISTNLRRFKRTVPLVLQCIYMPLVLQCIFSAPGTPMYFLRPWYYTQLQDLRDRDRALPGPHAGPGLCMWANGDRGDPVLGPGAPGGTGDLVKTPSRDQSP